jgi:site-specific DNA-methyltransferase (adenine-specific)
MINQLTEVNLYLDGPIIGAENPEIYPHENNVGKGGPIIAEGKPIEVNLFRDHFQNYKSYGIPKAQLIIADIPYNLGNNAYASNPAWYAGGDNENGESALAGKSFFDTDEDFRPAEFMHFCSTMLRAEKKVKEKVEGEARQKGDAPCMIVFCAFDQQMYLIDLAKKYGLNNYINLVFRKNFSAQVLKANMKVVGNCEYGLILYRDKLPKFRNNGKMIFNCMDWPRDNESEKIHPTQKPVGLLKTLIEIFTDEGDVVFDPCAGSGSTLVAAERTNRKGYGFEIKKEFHTKATKWIREEKQIKRDVEKYGFAKSQLEKVGPTLWS